MTTSLRVGTAAGNVALAEFFRVFVDFDGRGEGLRSAGHDVLNLPWGRGVRGRALGGVEGGDAAAGACADIDKPAAVTEAARHLVDDLRDLRKCPLDRGCNLRVFVVDDARDFKSSIWCRSPGRLRFWLSVVSCWSTETESIFSAVIGSVGAASGIMVLVSMNSGLVSDCTPAVVKPEQRKRGMKVTKVFREATSALSGAKGEKSRDRPISTITIRLMSWKT